MEGRRYYPIGEEHPNYKVERNEKILKDRYPNWPATGTIGMTVPALKDKYKLSRSRIYDIIATAKKIQFFKK